MDILDTSPFIDNVLVMRVTGAQLKQVLEQSFSQLRGLMQVSGIETVYDTSRPINQRLVSVTRNGMQIQDEDEFDVAVSGIIARGGDHYDMFLETEFVRELTPLADLMIAYYRKHSSVPVQANGRQTDVAMSDAAR